MRREDLGEPPWRDEPPLPDEGADAEAHAGLTDAPPTLEEALRVPDLDDGEVVRSIWDDLAGEAPVIERPVEVPDRARRRPRTRGRAGSGRRARAAAR